MVNLNMLNTLKTVKNNIKNSILQRGGEIYGGLNTYSQSINELESSTNTLVDGTKFKESTISSFPAMNTSEMTDMSEMFYNCNNITTIPQLDTSNVTNMNKTFGRCIKLTTIPLLDTSNVTDMGGMFEVCAELESIPQLDTSNVTDMSGMFFYCIKLKTIPLLDTSNVTNMNTMFKQCEYLTTIPQLDTSNVTSMGDMFFECPKLKSIPLLDASSLEKIGSGITIGTFYNCPRLTNIGGFKNFGMNSSIYVVGDFEGLTNLTHDSLMNIINNLYDRKSAGYSTAQLVLGSFNLDELSAEEIAIATRKGWLVS